jgi:Domain of unknown function (DUF4430)
VRTWLSAALAAGAVALGGCGLGAGKGTSDVSVTVTRSFGASAIGSVTKSKVPGSETVMRMLERSFHVQTRYGGGFVESIDGNSGNQSRLDWFYYVNGIEAPKGAAGTAVHRGDRIWWDLHDWSATDDVPAVVGSFPEPFIHGSNGRRYPTAIECAADVSSACTTVSNALSAQGVPVANQGLGTGSGQATIAVVVGPWSELQGLIAARLIEHGPRSSGVYARFDHGALQLLDPHGNVARTLGSDGGLIAATADQSSAPTWLITGTDPAGVASAAQALTPQRLHDHFALAVQGHTDIPLPVNGST